MMNKEEIRKAIRKIMDSEYFFELVCQELEDKDIPGDIIIDEIQIVIMDI